MTDRTDAGTHRSSRGRNTAVVALGIVVIAIIAVAFRGSWGSLRDAALAAHLDGTAADLYPFAVDGLLIAAIIVAVLLRHSPGARRYCFAIIGTYTAASWILNILHGLGWFSADPVTHVRPGPPWYVAILIASLVIGSIFLGTHLFVLVMRYAAPTSRPAPANAAADRDVPGLKQDVPPVPELPADVIAVAKDAYRRSLHPDMKTLSQADLIGRFRISKREASRVQNEVRAELNGHAPAEPSDSGAGEPLRDELEQP